MLKRRSKSSLPLLKWGGLVACAFALFAFFGEQGLFKLHQMNHNEARLEEMIVEIRDENDNLARELEWLKTPKYLEKVVRAELGFLRPDEVVYYVKRR